jgi:hypothetical protein
MAGYGPVVKDLQEAGMTLQNAIPWDLSAADETRSL